MQWLRGGVPLTVEAVKPHVGYVPQAGGLVDSMTVWGYLAYVCWLKRIPRPEVREQSDRALAVVNLTRHAERRVGSLSGGMRRRVLIAQALLGEPGLLLPLWAWNLPVTGPVAWLTLTALVIAAAALALARARPRRPPQTQV